MCVSSAKCGGPPDFQPQYLLPPGQRIKYVGMCEETLSSISSHWDEGTSAAFFFFRLHHPLPPSPPSFSPLFCHPSKSRAFSFKHTNKRFDPVECEMAQFGSLQNVVWVFYLNHEMMHESDICNNFFFFFSLRYVSAKQSTCTYFCYFWIEIQEMVQKGDMLCILSLIQAPEKKDEWTGDRVSEPGGRVQEGGRKFFLGPP